MRQDIQAVFFDAGYTLLCMHPDQPVLFRRVCAELDIELDDDRLAQGVKLANAMLAPRHPGAVPRPFSQAAVDRFWTEYNRLLLSVCARRPRDAEKAEIVYRRFTASIRWRIYDDVRVTLEKLRLQGKCLGVISNWSGDLEAVLESVKLREHFDFVLDSSRVGHEKPHAPIFLEALQRAGVNPNAAVHVGDSPEHDVEGALAGGLNAVLLDRNGRYADYTRAPRIEDLRQLEDVIVRE
jgi:putative hydrolase of the HAD superfamily